MGSINKQSLDTSINSRLQAGIHFSATIEPSSSSEQPGCKRKRFNGRGDCEPPSQRSCRIGGTNPRVLFPYLFGPQTRRRLASSYQPQATESVPSGGALQDGEPYVTEGSSPKERPNDKGRFERCLSYGSHLPIRPKVPSFQLEQQNLSVLLPAFWPSLCPSNLYKDLKTNGGLPKVTGSQVSDLFGRHSANVSNSSAHSSTSVTASVPPRGAGFCRQLSQEHAGAFSSGRISGANSGFTEYGPVCPTRENIKGSQRVSTVKEQGWSISQRPLSLGGTVVISDLGSASCTTPLQSIAEAQTPCSSINRILGLNGTFGFGISKRSIFLDHPAEESQWEDSASALSRFYYFYGCLTVRLGSLPQQQISEWSLGCIREGLPHQFFGNEGSLLSPEVLCIRSEGLPCPIVARQHYSYFIYKSQGRYQVSEVVRSGCRDLDLVPSEEYYNFCRAPSRSFQSESRLGISTPLRVGRLDPESLHFSRDNGSLGLVQHRSLCCQTQCPASTVLQLSAGSRSHSLRCFCPEVDRLQTVCLPSILSSREGPSESNTGANGGTDSDCTNVAVSGLVPSVAGTTDRLPETPSSLSFPASEPTGSTSSSSIAGEATTSRLESIRQSETFRQVSDEAFQLMSAAWRKGTEKSYSSAWSRWDSWCSSKQVNPILPSIENVLDFLTDHYRRGLQYSTLNSYRSSLSSTIPPIDGSPVGQHPLVTRLMQGIFNSRPPEPRYSHIWEVSKVLNYIQEQLGDSQSLSLKDLSKKTVMLLALAMAARSSDLHLLDIRYMTITPDQVQFHIAGLTKTRRSGPPREVIVQAFTEEQSVCPVYTLKIYLEKTDLFRSSARNRPNPLFLSFRRPHTPVSSSTIARWIRSTLEDSGIDVTIFKAHSTRAATTSAAKLKGYSTADILKMAGWSRSSTFEKFYRKPTSSNLIMVSL